jgi:hypothetical protein
MVLVVLFQPKGLMGVWDALLARRSPAANNNADKGAKVQAHG